MTLLHLNDFWKGILLGVLIGVLIGTTWEKAIELFVQAHNERKTMSAHRNTPTFTERMDSVWAATDRVWGWFEGITAIGLLLCFTSAMLIALGIFQIVGYTRMVNFTQCQAAYNQQAAIARDARIGVTDRENNLLFAALKDNILAAQQVSKLPPSQQQAASNRIEKKLIREFHMAVAAHEQRLDNAKAHPYPPNPEQTCGNY